MLYPNWSISKQSLVSKKLLFVNEEVKTEEGNPVSSNLGAIIAVAGRYYLSQSFLCVHIAVCQIELHLFG